MANWRTGDPATRRPGDPATRRPGKPANRQTGKPANRQTGKPANRQTGKPANRQTGKPANRQTGETIRRDRRIARDRADRLRRALLRVTLDVLSPRRRGTIQKTENGMSYVFPPAPVVAVPVVGSSEQ